MDYRVLLSGFERDAAHRGLARSSQQHRLYACLRSAILDGKIEEGTRLLASRTLAEELGMARNSVLYAYERLATEGFVLSQRQGTVVARVRLERTEVRPSDEASELSRRVATIDPPPEGMNDLLPFLTGTPALDEFPLAQWRRCMDRAMRDLGPGQLGYMPVEGAEALRQAIAGYLRISRGVRCDASQVLITDGTQSGLDLCARTLADAGDTAWIENPGYNRARGSFLAADLKLVPIPVDADGLAPTATDWADRTPRLIYITPSHQYPLGSVMSLERRLSLLEQAHASGAWIIEDDYDSEFRHQGAPLSALQGLTDDARVIYLGTFSKVMFPALRIGFMVVPVALARSMRRSAAALLLRGRVAEQMALADFIDAGHFTRHLRRMRRLYAERRAVLQDALERHLSDVLTVSGGAGGLHLSARLDIDVADTVVSLAARKRGLVLRALSGFCLPGSDAAAHYNGFVLGYGAVQASEMEVHVRRLREVIDEVVRG
ncbi:putative rhizopine catabolism regulatory protein MocR [Pararobbsia alpina]|uniref:MocR-like pyridoxine biosynthesis transcription factor PdxR n=1 Tax=Pararobbsia alpina TaxID=621374 RepID=UPI0039A6A623